MYEVPYRYYISYDKGNPPIIDEKIGKYKKTEYKKTNIYGFMREKQSFKRSSPIPKIKYFKTLKTMEEIRLRDYGEKIDIRSSLIDSLTDKTKKIPIPKVRRDAHGTIQKNSDGSPIFEADNDGRMIFDYVSLQDILTSTISSTSALNGITQEIRTQIEAGVATIPAMRTLFEGQIQLLMDRMLANKDALFANISFVTAAINNLGIALLQDNIALVMDNRNNEITIEQITESPFVISSIIMSADNPELAAIAFEHMKKSYKSDKKLTFDDLHKFFNFKRSIVLQYGLLDDNISIIRETATGKIKITQYFTEDKRLKFYDDDPKFFKLPFIYGKASKSPVKEGTLRNLQLQNAIFSKKKVKNYENYEYELDEYIEFIMKKIKRKKSFKYRNSFKTKGGGFINTARMKGFITAGSIISIDEEGPKFHYRNGMNILIDDVLPQLENDGITIYEDELKKILTSKTSLVTTSASTSSSTSSVLSKSKGAITSKK